MLFCDHSWVQSPFYHLQAVCSLGQINQTYLAGALHLQHGNNTTPLWTLSKPIYDGI